MIDISISIPTKQLNPDRNIINISFLFPTGRLNKIYIDEIILINVIKMHIEINIIQKVLIYTTYKPPI